MLTDLSREERQVRRVFDFEHARYRDSDRVHFRPRLLEELCADLGLPRAWFAGKIVLDAGCGSGRWSYALASMGARVVAVDLTDSGLRATAAALAPFPASAVYQASLFELPFEPESFDLVMSWGVLHHTPDTRAAFARLTPLVRPGGLGYVMLYERTARRYRLLTDLLRRALWRLPDALRYRACRALVIRDPRLYRAISPWLKVCDGSAARTERELSTLAFDTFDAYSPVFNHVHTQTEVRQWFHEEGFSDVVLTHPVRFTTRDAVERWGECGGAVHVRGVRAPSILVRGPAAGREASALRDRGCVADDEASARTWLAARVRAPAPQLAAAPFAAPKQAASPHAAATRRIVDRWHGLQCAIPADWTARREGRMLLFATPGAQPPFQLGLHVRPAARGPTLDLQASRAATRWFPSDQRFELLCRKTGEVAHRPATLDHYRVHLGQAGADVRFAHFVRERSLVQLSATTAWDALPSVLDDAAHAFQRFTESVRPAEPLRDASAIVGEVAGLIGSAATRAARLVRRGLRSKTTAQASAPPSPTAVSLAACYDADVDLSALPATGAASLIELARGVSVTYLMHRRAARGPAAGRIVR